MPPQKAFMPVLFHLNAYQLTGHPTQQIIPHWIAPLKEVCAPLYYSALLSVRQQLQLGLLLNGDACCTPIKTVAERRIYRTIIFCCLLLRGEFPIQIISDCSLYTSFLISTGSGYG